MTAENKVLGALPTKRAVNSAVGSRPVLLDLFCGAGGAGVGYARAGFEVIGVDIEPQPHYPFEFVQNEALDYLAAWGRKFDAIHASPPCQAYSAGSRMRTGNAKQHPKLIEPTRALLETMNLPYVIENVEGAPLINYRRYCGSAFGLDVRRHRLFESNVLLLAHDCQHDLQPQVVGVYGDHPEDALIRKGHPARRARNVADAAHAMDIDWMTTWHELKEAIPPAYTKAIGDQLIRAVELAA